jgi:hypothetical protein
MRENSPDSGESVSWRRPVGSPKSAGSTVELGDGTTRKKFKMGKLGFGVWACCACRARLGVLGLIGRAGRAL